MHTNKCLFGAFFLFKTYCHLSAFHHRRQLPCPIVLVVSVAGHILQVLELEQKFEI